MNPRNVRAKRQARGRLGAFKRQAVMPLPARRGAAGLMWKVTSRQASVGGGRLRCGVAGILTARPVVRVSETTPGARDALLRTQPPLERAEAGVPPDRPLECDGAGVGHIVLPFVAVSEPQAQAGYSAVAISIPQVRFRRSAEPLGAPEPTDLISREARDTLPQRSPSTGTWAPDPRWGFIRGCLLMDQFGRAVPRGPCL